MARLFDPMFSPPVMERLGLQIVKRIIESHNGKITVSLIAELSFQFPSRTSGMGKPVPTGFSRPPPAARLSRGKNDGTPISAGL